MTPVQERILEQGEDDVPLAMSDYTGIFTTFLIAVLVSVASFLAEIRSEGKKTGRKKLKQVSCKLRKKPLLTNILISRILIPPAGHRSFVAWK